MPEPGVTPSRRWGAAFAWTVVSQLVLGGTRMVLSIIIGRQLGKEFLGETTALLSLATFVVMLWPQATGVAAAKFVAVASRDADRDAVAWLAARSSLLVALPLGVLAGVWSAVVFATPAETSTTVGVLTVTMAVSASVRGIRNGRAQLARATYGDIAGSLLGLTLMAFVVSADLTSLVLLPIILSFLPAVALGWPRRVSSRSSEHREFLRFTGWTSLHILAASSLLPVVTILTAVSASPDSLGDLAAAASFATPAFLLSLAARSALEPFVAAEFTSRGRLGSQELIDSLLRGMVVVFVPLFGIGCLWAEDLLVRLYSPDYRTATPVLVVLFVAVGVNSLNAAHVWLSSTDPDGPRVLAAANLAGLVAGLLIASALLPVLGGLGAALGMLVGALVSTGTTTAVVWHRCRLPWAGLLVKGLVGVTLLMVAVAGPVTEDRMVRLALTLALVAAWSLLIRSDARRAMTLGQVVRPTS